MKICITATSKGLDAEIDPRFGRCQYFTIVNPESMDFESLENANIAASGGAGIQAAQFVANKEVEVVLTGNAGPNAYNTLEAAGIRVITGVSGNVRRAVEDFKDGKLQPPATGPTVDSHFGMGRGMGRGMGQGRMSGMPGSDPYAQPNQVNPDKSNEEEVRVLKKQSQEMKSQLENILQRIDSLESVTPVYEGKVTGISKIKDTLNKR